MLGTGFEPELERDPDAYVRQLRGLIPRVFDDIFERLGQMGEQTEVSRSAACWLVMCWALCCTHCAMCSLGVAVFPFLRQVQR